MSDEPEHGPEPVEPDETEARAPDSIRELGARLAGMVDANEAEVELELEAEPEEVDALTAAIAEAVQAHHDRIAELVGEGVDFKTCAYCLGMGVSTLELAQDPTSETCPTCKGFGSVTTGSKVDSRTMRPCPACQGNGFVETGREAEPGPAIAGVPAAPGVPVILPPSMLPHPDTPAPAFEATG